MLGPPEGYEEGVALAVDLDAAVLGEGIPQQAAMLGNNGAVALAELFEQPRRALDISEKEGDRSARQVGHR
jgi:hypothetical protein